MPGAGSMRISTGCDALMPSVKAGLIWASWTSLRKVLVHTATWLDAPRKTDDSQLEREMCD
jgi:hypothetical protein